MKKFTAYVTARALVDGTIRRYPAQFHSDSHTLISVTDAKGEVDYFGEGGWARKKKKAISIAKARRQEKLKGLLTKISHIRRAIRNASLEIKQHEKEVKRLKGLRFKFKDF